MKYLYRKPKKQTLAFRIYNDELLTHKQTLTTNSQWWPLNTVETNIELDAMPSTKKATDDDENGSVKGDFYDQHLQDIFMEYARKQCEWNGAQDFYI